MMKAGGSKAWSQDVKELNLTYVVLAQNLLKADRRTAMSQLGISDEMADLILAMSLQELTRLANNNFVLCSLRLDELPLHGCVPDASIERQHAAHFPHAPANRDIPVALAA